jgi:pyrophosphatase PpaX
MKPNAIFFDVDGTILPFEGIVRHLQNACRHFKVRIVTKKEIMENAVGYTIKESMPKLVPETKKFINEFSDYYRSIYNKDVKAIKPFPSVKKVFTWIKKRNIKIGIVTTKSRIQAEVTLNYYKLPYNVVIGHDDVKKRKPNPEPVLKACKILGLKPKDCIFVGDHPFDMIASRRAGCLPVGVLTGWGNRKNLKAAGAKYLIKDLRGLKKIIE